MTKKNVLHNIKESVGMHLGSMVHNPTSVTPPESAHINHMASPKVHNQST